MALKRICIDLSNIVPGKGGSGGGIANYAFNLVKGLNKIDDKEKIQIICIKHPDFKALDAFKNIRIVNSDFNTNLFKRFIWIHIYLPFYCVYHKINLLHRVTPELPFVKVCKYIC